MRLGINTRAESEALNRYIFVWESFVFIDIKVWESLPWWRSLSIQNRFTMHSSFQRFKSISSKWFVSWHGHIKCTIRSELSEKYNKLMESFFYCTLLLLLTRFQSDAINGHRNWLCCSCYVMLDERVLHCYFGLGYILLLHVASFR